MVPNKKAQTTIESGAAPCLHGMEVVLGGLYETAPKLYY
jgi:hypothetical protein